MLLLLLTADKAIRSKSGAKVVQIEKVKKKEVSRVCFSLGSFYLVLQKV
jgi:hypothetical protein